MLLFGRYVPIMVWKGSGMVSWNVKNKQRLMHTGSQKDWSLFYSEWGLRSPKKACRIKRGPE